MDNYGFIMFVISMSVIGFLILREVVCWYFKINERLSVSKKMLAELERINSDINHVDMRTANDALTPNSIKSQG